jgi:hypothetical protein
MENQKKERSVYFESGEREKRDGERERERERERDGERKREREREREIMLHKLLAEVRAISTF